MVIPLSHSADLSRTTNGQGLVSDLTLAQIRRLDAGLGERVPTLAQVVELARGQVQLYVELKEHDTPAPVVQTLRAAAFVELDPWLSPRVKLLEPRIRTSVLSPWEDRHADYVEWAGGRGGLCASL
jgi:glycerophosphoryl diester phosphodiesterase